MRTTVQINDTLLDQVKREALRRHTTLGAVIDEALRKVFAKKQASSPAAATDLPVFKGKGLQPGVDLDSTASLLDHMEGR